MSPVGWEALGQWGEDAARIEPLAGGVANDVWSVRVNGHLAVGRLGARSDADLAWETELLKHLDREGLTVPVPIPTTDGRLFADGLVVMAYVEGGPPRDGGRLASHGRHAPPAAWVDAGLAAAPRFAINHPAGHLLPARTLSHTCRADPAPGATISEERRDAGALLPCR